MTDQSRFLRLPRELRDKIYSYYVFEVNGYCYNPHTGKLRVGGEPEHCIDQSLQYACTMVAAEMRGVGLRENTIHFKAFKDHGTKASRFEWLIKTQKEAFGMIISRVTDLFTLDVLESLREKYPDNNTLKELIKNPDPDNINHSSIPPAYSTFSGFDPWIAPTTGETPSLNRALVQDMIQLVLSKPSSNSKVVRMLSRGISNPEYRSRLRPKQMPIFEDSYLTMLDWRPSIWKVPTVTELDHAETFLHRDIERKGRTNTIHWYWPACTTAIQFLSDLGPELRSSLRHIIIHEDRNCVAHPETHARGLISFMHENHLLYVEQHMDISHVIVAPRGCALAIWAEIVTPATSGGTEIAEFLYFMALWIIEAMALKDYGMPEKAFSLTFHGLPDLQQKFWDGLKRMALVHETMLEFSNRGIPNSLRFFRTQNNWHPVPTNEDSETFLSRPKYYVADGFSEAIKRMVSGTSNIHLPAAIKGEPWDIEDAVKEISVDQEILIHCCFDYPFYSVMIEDDDLGMWYDHLRDFYWNGERADLDAEDDEDDEDDEEDEEDEDQDDEGDDDGVYREDG